MGEEIDPRRLLAEQPELYRNHLLTAVWIEGWRERLREASAARNVDHDDGIDYALREIIAHLRQGDFLPGGALLAELGE